VALLAVGVGEAQRHAGRHQLRRHLAVGDAVLLVAEGILVRIQHHAQRHTARLRGEHGAHDGAL
jgi:hypothetical protein